MLLYTEFAINNSENLNQALNLTPRTIPKYKQNRGSMAKML